LHAKSSLDYPKPIGVRFGFFLYNIIFFDKSKVKIEIIFSYFVENCAALIKCRFLSRIFVTAIAKSLKK